MYMGVSAILRKRRELVEIFAVGGVGLLEALNC